MVENKTACKAVHYSYWQLFNLYANCPKSYEIAYERKLRPIFPFSATSARITLRGAIFHAVMDQKVKSKWSWADAVQNVDAVAKDILKPGTTGAELLKGLTTLDLYEVEIEVQDALVLFSSSPHKVYADSLVKTEFTISNDVDSIRLAGRVDGYGVLNGRSYYIDWKLHTKASSSFSRQLVFYSLIEPVDDTFVYFPVPGVLKPCRMSEVRNDRLKQVVHSLVTKLELGDRSMNYKHCSRCYYVGVCRPGFAARLEKRNG